MLKFVIHLLYNNFDELWETHLIIVLSFVFVCGSENSVILSVRFLWRCSCWRFRQKGE